MTISYKIKLKLNKTQMNKINSIFVENNSLYNMLITKFLEMEKLVSSTGSRYFYTLNPLVPSQIAQNTCTRARESVKRFKTKDKSGKKFGKPRYKTNSTKRSSFSYSISSSQGNYISQFGNIININIPKVGKIKGKGDTRKIEGKVKQIIVKRDSCGDYWASIVTDYSRVIELPQAKCEEIGVDLGLKHTFTASNEDGSVVIQPNRLNLSKKHADNLARVQRSDPKSIPFVHRKIQRQRNNNQWNDCHKLLKLGNKIYVGKLNSKFMFANHKLARSAYDASHSSLILKLNYLAESANNKREVIQVNEAYTSQECWKCGNRNGNLKLQDRVYECSCGYLNDRDVNASMNILKRGKQLSLSLGCRDVESKPKNRRAKKLGALAPSSEVGS